MQFPNGFGPHWPALCGPEKPTHTAGGASGRLGDTGAQYGIDGTVS